VLYVCCGTFSTYKVYSTISNSTWLLVFVLVYIEYCTPISTMRKMVGWKPYILQKFFARYSTFQYPKPYYMLSTGQASTSTYNTARYITTTIGSAIGTVFVEFALLLIVRFCYRYSGIFLLYNYCSLCEP
jgi:hypothetical protein